YPTHSHALQQRQNRAEPELIRVSRWIGDYRRHAERRRRPRPLRPALREDAEGGAPEHFTALPSKACDHKNNAALFWVQHIQEDLLCVSWQIYLRPPVENLLSLVRVPI